MDIHSVFEVLIKVLTLEVNDFYEHELILNLMPAACFKQLGQWQQKTGNFWEKAPV